MRSSLANGIIPKTISTPLLSTNITAHLCGGPFNLSNQISKSSINHGLD